METIVPGDAAALDQLPPDLAMQWFARSTVAVVVTDAQVEEPGPRILYVNDRFCAMSGYDRAAVMGRSPRFMQGVDTSREVLTRLRRALLAREYFEGETWNYRADGTPFLMQWTISTIRSVHDGREYFVAAQRDVTELRRLEADTDLQELPDNGALYFAGLRQELRAPLQSIRAAVDHLRTLQPSDHASLALDRIVDDLGRAQRSLGEERGPAPHDGAALDTIDVREFLRTFTDHVQTECQSRGYAIDLQIAQTAPTFAFCERRGLHLVLMNLVTNALDALVARDELPAEQWTLDAVPRPVPADARLHLDVDGLRNGAWTIEVHDAGTGMTPDTLERIFLPLFTTKRSGTGLGLPLVKRALRRMGGTLSVRSTPGAGSVFTVYLPGPAEVFRD